MKKVDTKISLSYLIIVSVWLSITLLPSFYPDAIARSTLQPGDGTVPDATSAYLPLIQEGNSPTGTQLPSRIIIIGIDSLDPDYIDFDATASGPGSPGNWLMPRVRAFVEESTYWPNATGHFPHSTDSNHLNIIAGTNTGMTGFLGVLWQPEKWESRGLTGDIMHLGKARYPDGSQVKTLFDLVSEAGNGNAKTAYISNKNWVAVEYGEDHGKTASVDIIAQGETYPVYVTTEPYYQSFHDNPLTDLDAACDPESEFQTRLLDPLTQWRPALHPRDAWVAETAIQVMARENPEMIYILLGDLDYAQHNLGAVNNPEEWTVGPVPALPEGCAQQPQYRLISKRNPNLYKEPILDLIRDVDLAFGQLVDGLDERGYLANAVVVLMSDHSMINLLYREGINDLTDVLQKLKDAQVAPQNSFYFHSGESVGLLYWRPLYKLLDPSIVTRAKAELLDDKHRVQNPETNEGSSNL